jgi:hypothetical protein
VISRLRIAGVSQKSNDGVRSPGYRNRSRFLV